MTDPDSRQVEELEALLLRAGREHAPPRGSLRRAMVSVGVAAPLVLVVTKAAALLGTAAGKGIVAAAVVAVGVVAYLGMGTRPAASDSDSAPPASALPAPAKAPVAQEPAQDEPVQPSEPAAAPEQPAAPAVRPARRSGTAPSAADTLPAEIAAVDAIRAALRSGDHEAAMRRGDAYDRRFPGGTLAHEVATLRARAARAAREE